MRLRSLERVVDYHRRAADSVEPGDLFSHGDELEEASMFGWLGQRRTSRNSLSGGDREGPRDEWDTDPVSGEESAVDIKELDA